MAPSNEAPPGDQATGARSRAARAERRQLHPVALLGTGPGDPGLLTMRAAQLLREADAVVADPAVAAEVLRGLDAEIIDAAAEGVDPVKETVALARAGKRVVRAVLGDPLEQADVVKEAQALTRAKVVFELVAGVSPAVAAPTYAGVAVGATRTMATVAEDTDWAGLAAAPGTLVLELDAVGAAGKAAAALIEHGRRPDTPVSITVGATSVSQETVVTVLEALDGASAGLGAAGRGSAVVVVGAAVKTREKLSWFETRALFGWTVLVPRTREQASVVSDEVRALGGVPLEVPTIAVEPPRTPAPMERAIRGLVSGSYQWIAFTSTNAVRAIRERFEELGLDARAFSGVKVAAVGEVTAAALTAWGIVPELTPSGEQSSEGLLADWPPYDDVLDPIDRVFLPRADIATETLVAGLKERGWEVDDVTAYRTVRAAPPPAPVREALKGGGVDAVLFTSSSTVRNLVGIAGKPHERTTIAVIGPQTAAAATELGLRVDVQASEPTTAALVAALADFARHKRETEPQGATVTPLRPRRRR